MVGFFMRNKEFWFFLFALGVLFFSWPLLDIFSMSLVYYFPVAWGMFIFVVYLVVQISDRQLEDKND
ncbi:MAG TPA: hypothetical protein VEP69_05340 [Thermodesulfovibrionales bacterium]|nr:hypothetical protein [Thermodesulfovibrionales bacterium]